MVLAAAMLGEMCRQEAYSGEDLVGDITFRSRHTCQAAALAGLCAEQRAQHAVAPEGPCL